MIWASSRETASSSPIRPHVFSKATRVSVFRFGWSNSGFIVDRTSDIETLIWGKLAVNAAINPLTAILRVPNGDLLKQSSTRNLMAITASEVEALAFARSIQLPFDDVAIAVEEVAHRTASNKSSMLQDVIRGAPTEIEAINGAIVRMAEQADVSTPVNRTLWLIVKSIISRESNQRE